MTDEQFKEEVEELVRMLENYHLIKDKGLTQWMKAEIRDQVNNILNKDKDN
jgi:hypothetical protein